MFVCKIITTDLLACVNYPEVKKNFNFDVLISNLSFHSTFVILIWLVTICSLIRRFFLEGFVRNYYSSAGYGHTGSGQLSRTSR